MADALSDLYHRAFGGQTNLSFGERAASVGFGLAAAAAGLRRGGFLGALMGIAGGALALRGASGHCALKAALQQGDFRPMLPGTSGRGPDRQHPVGGPPSVA